MVLIIDALEHNREPEARGLTGANTEIIHPAAVCRVLDTLHCSVRPTTRHLCSHRVAGGRHCSLLGFKAQKGETVLIT